MQKATRQEQYKSFIEFIENDIQRERRMFNRRMFNVFLWCFFIPSFTMATILLLVKLKIFPIGWRYQLDWLLLVLPTFYSIYILSFEVLARVPATMKKGGIASSLGQAVEAGEWRVQVCDSMSQAIHANAQEWRWIVASFKMDLDAMQHRVRYLTALAGAVFFLIMQGIDSIVDGEEKVTWIKTSTFGWIQTSTSDLTQFVGLALFLILLYLSGNQAYHTLKRYLNCAELMVQKCNH